MQEEERQQKKANGKVEKENESLKIQIKKKEEEEEELKMVRNLVYFMIFFKKELTESISLIIERLLPYPFNS